jgi:hypothetical protein
MGSFVPEEAKNVGGLDRKLRAVLGTLLALAGAGLFATGRVTVAVMALAGGAGLLFNAVTGFCGMNALFGVDTCSRE